MGKIKIYISSQSAGISMLLLAIIISSGCTIEKRLSNSISRDFKHSNLMKKHQVGFVLYDPVTGRQVYEKNGDQYFTPASNVKLFTFYAALKILKDSVPSFRYTERNDSLIFWGTGDPSLLQTRLKDGKALASLKATNKKLFFASGRYTGTVYGKGWGIDDYNDYYQAEVNELPLMDNLVAVKSVNGVLLISPNEFSACFLKDTTDQISPFKITREVDGNRFHYPSASVPKGFTQEIPYRVSSELTLKLLADTLKKSVSLIKMALPADAKTIFNVKRDTLLKQMMHPSDNFIAEQLLLVCADRLGIEMNTEKVIHHLLKNYLSNLPDSAVWVDGSGLSRGNLFTPRDVVMVLDLIYKGFNDREKLFELLPAGGKAGTLRNAYPKTNVPYVFGKTGTLANQYNQSGYVLTRKGRLYIFSFMNNNFVLPTKSVRNEIGRIITNIHENF